MNEIDPYLKRHADLEQQGGLWLATFGLLLAAFSALFHAAIGVAFGVPLLCAGLFWRIRQNNMYAKAHRLLDSGTAVRRRFSTRSPVDRFGDALYTELVDEETGAVWRLKWMAGSEHLLHEPQTVDCFQDDEDGRMIVLRHKEGIMVGLSETPVSGKEPSGV